MNTYRFLVENDNWKNQGKANMTLREIGLNSVATVL
jgi:CYTH domain-containing protein